MVNHIFYNSMPSIKSTDSCSTVSIQRQRVSCLVGVPDEERAHPQELEISVHFAIPDCALAARHDDLADTVDYSLIHELVNQIASERPRRLIETLAHDLAKGISDRFALDVVEVEIRKFILPATEAVVLTHRHHRCAGDGS